ncbi:MAG: hypothetical protein JSR82_06490 [Verrucomicrobia bacterium]|nr:hypothetical protein [Verrucomicrobiota bacterium]
MEGLTDWQSGGTNAFQRDLLAEEGVLEQVQFGFSPTDNLGFYQRYLEPLR